MQRIDKIPSYCSHPNMLQAGDIVIFNINPRQQAQSSQAGASGTFITSEFQKGLNEWGGHNETVHAGFIVERNGVKQIAHLRAKGFILDDINIIKTTTHIYRPKKHQAILAETLNEIVAEGLTNNQLKKIKWRRLVTIRAYLRRLFTSLGIKQTNPDKIPVSHSSQLSSWALSKWSICSKFVADVYISACHRMSQKDNQHLNFKSQLMNINSFTTPKTLQAYLYRNANYDYYVLPYARENLLTQLVDVLNSEINRLRISSNHRAQTKADKLEHELATFQALPEATPIQNAIRLLKSISPILKINTKTGAKQPASYGKVMNFSKSQGIYRAYIEDQFYHDSQAKVATLATSAYHYSAPMAKLYSRYRKLGFSDEEAVFECKPKPRLIDWLALHPRRNVAAGCLGLPFLFWSIPYGMVRVNHIRHRNKQWLK